MPIKEEILKQLDLYNSTFNLIYDGKNHTYRINGELCAGVSTVSSYGPSDWLKFWAAKVVSEYLIDKQDLIKTLTPKQYLELLKDAKNAPNQKSKDSLKIGKKVHDWIEKHINGEDLPITDEIKHPVSQFLEFEKKHSIDWICVETIVGSLEHKIGGRLDALAIVDGKVSLVDFKTSGHIDESYYLQTAGYQLCLEEMGVKVEQRIILRLPKVLGEDFEAVLVDTPYDKDKNAFLHRRYSCQWQNYIDSHFKEDKGYGTATYKVLKLKKL